MGLDNLTTTEKYVLIGRYTKDLEERKILGQRYVDGMDNEAIIRGKYGDDFLDKHSDRVRKKKLDAESKKLTALFDKFESSIEEVTR